MIYEAPQEKRYPFSWKGLRELSLDWWNTPQPEERIVLEWPLDLICGLILLTPPFIAGFIG
ncbi:hypothetical protein [uncultured Sphingorhabdus sp.]|uniref:hypothetical protein n=1 Tax=uncultured Sphingorhabdus sp. TaxID=1686106 RepID=UPI0026399C28|nr:hypothetical protein [uncultured Sphingorhabdus sp.]